MSQTKGASGTFHTADESHVFSWDSVFVATESSTTLFSTSYVPLTPSQPVKSDKEAPSP